MTTKHIHHNVICAWARGETIQVFYGGKWVEVPQPSWGVSQAFRVKPAPRTAHQIYLDAVYPEGAPHAVPDKLVSAENGFAAVINAVKSGELS